MKELIAHHLIQLYQKEIEEISGTISNERIWELGYDGPEQTNPHTLNIINLISYKKHLQSLLDDCKKVNTDNPDFLTVIEISELSGSSRSKPHIYNLITKKSPTYENIIDVIYEAVEVEEISNDFIADIKTYQNHTLVSSNSINYYIQSIVRTNEPSKYIQWKYMATKPYIFSIDREHSEIYGSQQFESVSVWYNDKGDIIRFRVFLDGIPETITYDAKTKICQNSMFNTKFNPNEKTSVYDNKEIDLFEKGSVQ